MTERAVPVVIAGHVAGVAGFYEALGFVRHFQFPPEGEPGYVGLRRGASELAVVAAEWPQQQYGRAPAPECVSSCSSTSTPPSRVCDGSRQRRYCASPRGHALGRESRLRHRPGGQPGRARRPLPTREAEGDPVLIARQARQMLRARLGIRLGDVPMLPPRLLAVP